MSDVQLRRTLLDRMIESLAPVWGARRQAARVQLTAVRQYEAAKQGRERRNDQSFGSADRVLHQGFEIIRNRARYADENHDLASGVLDVLVDHTVGTAITTHPMARLRDGSMAADFNKWMTEHFEIWSERCDVSQQLTYGDAQRLLARSKFRDGEAFVREYIGSADIDYPTKVPYAIQLLESDMVPNTQMVELENGDRVRHGVVVDAYGKPKQYLVFNEHPGDMLSTMGLNVVGNLESLIRSIDGQLIDADMIMHPRCVKRIGQTRGLSVLHNVLNRLEDLKDYEDAERLAAKLGAYMALQITKSSDLTQENSSKNSIEPRTLRFMPGVVWDNLSPGEKVEVLENKRPSNNIPWFRDTMMAGVASGVGAGKSSVSKNYNGTYSAQRQELKEQEIHYAVATDRMVGEVIRRVYRRFVQVAIMSRAIPRRYYRNVDQSTLLQAAFRGRSVAYIDPVKEIEHEIRAVQAGFRSKRSVIMQHGGDPEQVEAEIKAEREREEEDGIVNTSNPKNKVGVLDVTTTDEDDTDDTGGEPANPPASDEEE
ncbi:MAG: phage portal protein [Pseudomonadota bacterium]